MWEKSPSNYWLYYEDGERQITLDWNFNLKGWDVFITPSYNINIGDKSLADAQLVAKKLYIALKVSEGEA
jgi:hypothetical protein